MWANVPPDTPLASLPGFTATTADDDAGDASEAGGSTAADCPPAAASSGRSLAKGARLEGSSSRSGELRSCRAL